MDPRAARFHSLYAQGFARVAAGTPMVALADPRENARRIGELAAQASRQGAAVALFPELALTGYSIDDLLHQGALLDAAEAAAASLIAASAELLPLIAVGCPLRHRDRLFNAALVIHRGRLLGVVPKAYLPNYREFYEDRHFAPGLGERGGALRFAGQEAPFGVDLLFRAADLPGLTVHVEVCEDLWVPHPPSSDGARAGATVLLNLSASPVTVGRAGTRRALAVSQSMRCIAAYAYTAAGAGESTTDLAWDGHAMVVEDGAVLAEGERFAREARLTVADVDLARLRAERLRVGTFHDGLAPLPFREVAFTLAPPGDDLGLRRRVERFPFAPSDPARLDQDCFEAYNIQVDGLARRLEASGAKRLVIGVSGGLDSTHALVVAARAFDLLGRPRADILGFALPGFATGERTSASARGLMGALGITAESIDIRPAAQRMLADMGHPFARGEPTFDVTFENVQAGLRTDYLFRLANQRDGLVLGTGDLSELALGWCTYGVGDHMSHYAVNASVPKTLIQFLLRWVVKTRQLEPAALDAILDVLATEISPELVPPGADGAMQRTEDVIGPYALQDFTLYHLSRYGFAPSRAAFLALHAWGDEGRGGWPEGYPEDAKRAYDLATIRRWLKVFCARFYGTTQFKRSAIPNGPKVTSGGSLSPRGDWRAPSDAPARAWLDEIEANVPEEG